MLAGPLEGLAEALFKEAGDALFLFEPESGQILEVNPTAQRLSGFSREELLHMQTTSLLQAEWADANFRLRDAHRHTTSFHARDGFLLRTRQEGLFVPVNVTITRLHVMPRTLGLITARDVRDQRDTFLRVKKVEMELRRVLTSVSDCLWSAKIDLAGRWHYRYFSPVSESITGRPPRFFMDQIDQGGALPWGSIVDPRDRESWERSVARMRAGQSVHEEYRILRANGGICWIRESVRASRVGDDQALMLDGVITDITSRKIQDEELHAAKEAAEAASRAKSDFLAKMSHEIRTPLNGVLGMAELAIATDLTAEQQRYLEILQASAQSLLTIIDDILDFSRIEAGKLELDCRRFALRELLDETLSMLAIRAHQKGLELSYRVQWDVPDALLGDPARLQQIVVNLVTNAVKFTDHGEVAVEVAAIAPPSRPDPRADDIWLEFIVTDTGPGIPADKHQIIFESFAQADPSATRKHGGAGLGLSIAGQLVRLMEGELKVQSQEGQGSQFHFTVRLRRDSQPDPHCWHREQARNHLNGRRILLLDFHPRSGRILTEILEGWGMEPVSVESRDSATSAFHQAVAERRPFDLALIEIEPSRHGTSLGVDPFWKSLCETARPTPVVALLQTAQLSQDAEECRRLGVCGYLTKPVRESALADVLIKAMTSHPASHPPSATPSAISPSRAFQILLAEDNAVNQIYAQTLLEQRGHRVVIARNGHEAVDRFEHEKFDMILMDLQMPEMDGFAATAAIRQREGKTGSRIPIVALTAHAMKGFREQCLAAGMDAYLSKPVQANELLAALQQFYPSAGGRTANRNVMAAVSPEPILRIPFDRDAALARLGDDLTVFRTLISAYFLECPALLEKIRASSQAADTAEICRSAHTLKGMLATLAAGPACAAARRLEVSAAAGAANIAPALAELEHELDRLDQAFRQECEDPRPFIAGDNQPCSP